MASHACTGHRPPVASVPPCVGRVEGQHHEQPPWGTLRLGRAVCWQRWGSRRTPAQRKPRACGLELVRQVIGPQLARPCPPAPPPSLRTQGPHCSVHPLRAPPSLAQTPGSLPGPASGEPRNLHL